MSLLIKGLKAPKDDESMVIVLVRKGEEAIDCNDGYGTKIAEAVELPDHGDLIDRDELIKHEVYMPMSGGNLPVIYTSYVKGARAVIPAERE